MTLKEVAMKEMFKWLNHGIIYSIFDNKCVSFVQVVPKKTDIIVIRNDKNKLVPKTSKGLALRLPIVSKLVQHRNSSPMWVACLHWL